MSTPRQIAANRLNAQHSTGPRSAEGKAAASANSLKTGLYARSQVIAGEDPAELRALADQYFLRWQPATPEESFLVATLVDADWLLRRYALADAKIWDYQGAADCVRNDPNGNGLNFIRCREYFPLLQRRIDSAQRTFHRALHDLERLQAKRQASAPQSAHQSAKAPAAEPPPEAKANSAHPQSNQQIIGFVPSFCPRRNLLAPSPFPPSQRSHLTRLLFGSLEIGLAATPMQPRKPQSSPALVQPFRPPRRQSPLTFHRLLQTARAPRPVPPPLTLITSTSSMNIAKLSLDIGNTGAYNRPIPSATLKPFGKRGKRGIRMQRLSSASARRPFLRAISTFAVVLGLFCSQPAFAQLSSASVTGVVRDQSGSVVTGAKLTLTNIETAVKHESSSNNAGNYLFLSIPPGQYSLEVSAPSFTIARVPQFVLAVNQTATIDVSLQVGSLAQTVNVEATGELLQSSTAEVGAVVAAKQVVDLPLNGRNFTQLLTLSPGVAPVSVSQNSGGFGNAATGTQFVFPAINGQTNRSNYFMTDGLNNQGAFSSTYAVPPIVDSIGEFKVNGHNDLAEFGGALGGIINVATKSGTNELHGTAWEYLRNDFFNARNTFQPAVTVFRQNQYGISGGGPVILPKLYNGKNKTFFYGAYEGYKYSRAANSYLHLPTDAEFAGNLSGEAQAYNPFSTRPDPNKPGGFIRDPFPGNQIPASLIDTRLVSFAKSIRPALVNTGVANNNVLDNTPAKQNQEEYTARIDQNIGTKDFIWFRYSAIYYDTSGSGGLPGVVTSITDNPGQNFGASWVHTFGPGLVLQAQFGRSHQETNSFNSYGTAVNASTLGFDPTFSGGFIGDFAVLPSVGISNYSTVIPAISRSLNPNETNVHQWKANVSKTFGSHTFRWGGELNSSTFESLYNSANVGYALQQTADPSNPSANPGNAMASFLLNVPDSAGRRNVHETTRWGGVMGFYFQDSWKASQRLTVNLGLRYDRTFIPPYGLPETAGFNGGIEAGSIDFNSGTYIVQKLPPSCTARGHAPCIPGDGTLPAHVVVSPNGKIYHDTTTNWGPRIGLAYRASPTIAVRAGFGVYYDNWAAVTQTSQNYEGTWPDIGQQLANNLNVPVSSQPTPNIKGQSPFAAGGGAFPAPTPFQQVQWYMDPYAKNPYSMQWNFGVAKQFNDSTTVNLDYVGSGSRRLDVGGYYNVALTPGPGDPSLRQPYTYIHPTYYDRSIGRGNYNALQFLFSKRYSGGLSYQISYTYSKAIDIASSGWYGVEGQSEQDPYHYNNDRSVSGFDITHVLTANIVYELPFGTGKKFATGNKAADFLLGGWQFNTITTARTGLPYNITVPGDSANTGNTGYLRADLVGDPNISNPTPAAWFNKSAFAAPGVYTFGNLGRYAMRNSAFWNMDVSMFRAFRFMEKRSIEFRAESFNLPNTVIMGTPNGNVLDPNFGKVTGTQNSPRSLQLGAKIIF